MKEGKEGRGRERTRSMFLKSSKQPQHIVLLFPELHHDSEYVYILLKKVFCSINKFTDHKMDKMIDKAPSGSVNLSRQLKTLPFSDNSCLKSKGSPLLLPLIGSVPFVPKECNKRQLIFDTGLENYGQTEFQQLSQSEPCHLVNKPGSGESAQRWARNSPSRCNGCLRTELK